MNRVHFRSGLAALGFVVLTTVGCQTQIPTTLQTLPSPRYLDHPPQYVPPSPPFPHQRELLNLERSAAAASAGVAPGGPLPPAVPVPRGGAELTPLDPPPPE